MNLKRLNINLSVVLDPMSTSSTLGGVGSLTDGGAEWPCCVETCVVAPGCVAGGCCWLPVCWCCWADMTSSCRPCVFYQDMKLGIMNSVLLRPSYAGFIAETVQGLLGIFLQ